MAIKDSFSDIFPFFSAADNYCREKLGYLVEYENKAQEELLHNYLRPIYAEDTTFWIGLRDFHTEDTFIWEHSKKTTNVSGAIPSISIKSKSNRLDRLLSRSLMSTLF